MVDQTHSRGPWRIGEGGSIYCSPTKVTLGGVVCTVTDPDHPSANADARRIVACVNACEGISSEALEAGWVGDMQALLRVD